ncbi:hypothetical protein [Vibrio phage vB_ValS_PJ32]|nr:hypothetical protein [Vibrio phage vB_ValS_PJ32]
MENVTKSLVVDFESGGDSKGANGGALYLEYDNRDVLQGGLNKRKQPLFSDKAFFLLYPFRAANLTASVSSGSVLLDSRYYTDTIEEIVIFDNSDESSVRRPIHRIIDVEWYGSNWGFLNHEGTTVKCSASGNFACKVTYESRYHVISVTPPTLDPDKTNEYTINLIVTADEVLEDA